MPNSLRRFAKAAAAGAVMTVVTIAVVLPGQVNAQVANVSGASLSAKLPTVNSAVSTAPASTLPTATSSAANAPAANAPAANAPAANAPAATAPAATAPVAKAMASDVVKPLAAFSASLGAIRDSLVARARAQIGTRYKLGGTAPERGFDCSGLVRFVAKAFDISLPRTARQQATMGVAIPKDLAAMKPGDLLTFGRGSVISHIGIYVGDGKMVHASTSQKRVIETSLVGTRSPLIKQWKGVRRVAETSGFKLRDSLLAMLDSIP